MKKISNIKYLKYIKYILEIFILGISMFLLWPVLPKSIWIISEREDQAQDNGIAFFKYLRECKREEVSSFYILEKNSRVRKEIEKIGPVLVKGSIKHKVLFLKSIVIATTEKDVIEPWGSDAYYKYLAWIFPKKVRVFLQHGITDKDVSHVYGSNVSNFDLFITASEREREFVINKLLYKKEQVVCTGLARYDYLNFNYKENTILFMPTWRRYLINPKYKSEEDIKQYKKEFVMSDYYKRINSFLNSEELKNILIKENINFKFVSHYTMNSMIDEFNVNCDKINIFKSEEVVIGEEISKCKIFITDYSSTHFDSGYLGNSNIYYQFDKEEFMDGHADKSYFSYENDGFGDVVYNEEEVINSIKKIIKNQCINNKTYLNRSNMFFKYRDKNNCSRIYNTILGLIGKGV